MSDPYLDAVKLLARRELSEAQVRQRLARRGHDEDCINDAIARLKQEGAIDDERVAAAIAHTETAVKRRGKLRVKRRIESAGIARATVGHVVDEVFGQMDDQTLIEAALAKRLRPGTSIRDDREFQRFYRYLIGQGFEADQVIQTLEARRHRGSA